MTIPLLGATLYTVYRFLGAPIDTTDGRTLRPRPTTVPVTATLAPATKANRKQLPDGVTVENAAVGVCYSEIIPSRDQCEGNRYGDRLIFRGLQYEAVEVTEQPAMPEVGQPAHWETVWAVCEPCDLTVPS